MGKFETPLMCLGTWPMNGRQSWWNGLVRKSGKLERSKLKMPAFMLEGPRPCTILCFGIIRFDRLRDVYVKGVLLQQLDRS